MQAKLTLAVVGLSLLVASCCKSSSEEPKPTVAAAEPTTAAEATATPTPIAAKTVDSPVTVGTPVMAPWSRSGKMYGGRVTEVYGKLVHVDFNDGDKGWALVEQCRPRGLPQPTPSDTCSFSAGDKVKAPWSRNKAMYSGIVGETHGKLALVNFLDGDRGWALCAEMQAR